MFRPLIVLFLISGFAGISRAQEINVRPFGFLDVYQSRNIHDLSGTQLNHHLNHRYSAQTSLNIAAVGLEIFHEQFRGSVALMAGLYTRMNFLANADSSGAGQNFTEPDEFRHLYQAWGGIKLTETLWLDAGVFESYIGNENLRGVQNLHLTRSLTSDFTPYYLTGIRLVSANPTKRVTRGFYILNGYQRMVSYERDADLGLGYNRVQEFGERGGQATVNVFLGRNYASRNAPQPEYETLLVFDLNGSIPLSGGFKINPQLNFFFQGRRFAETETFGSGAVIANVQVEKKVAENWFISGRTSGLFGATAVQHWAFDRDPGKPLYDVTVTATYRPAEKAAFRMEMRKLYSASHDFADSRNPFTISAGVQMQF